MVHPSSLLASLFAAPVQPGSVVWLGVRPKREAPIITHTSIQAEAGKGLAGDRYKTKTNGARQVTLIDAAALETIAGYLRRDRIDAALLRRNIVVQGINLLALKNKRFKVGEAILEYSGECHPCSKMENTLGTGGYNAVRGQGGITARIIQSGTIAVGDEVQVIMDRTPPAQAGAALTVHAASRGRT